MTGNTVSLHRVLRAPPERVYRAFIIPEAMAKWIPPNGFTATVHHMDVRVGGAFKMSFTNFTTQQSHSFGGEYLELFQTCCSATPTNSTTRNLYENVSRATAHVRVAPGLTVMWRVSL